MKRNIIFYISTFILLASSSCDNILDVEPKQSIPSETALVNEDAITAALNSVYARLQPVSHYGRDLIAIPEVLADNTIHTGSTTRLVAESTNQIGAHMDNWQSSYYAINEINNILQALGPLSAAQDFKDGIEGQLHFLRALFYHNLMRIFAYDPTAVVNAMNNGGVPIMETAVISTEQIELKGREPIDVVYNYIYTELDRAYQLLQATPNSRAPYYATAGAAAALFTRVALYNGDYAKVISEADKALASGVGVFQSSANYINSWRAVKHPESMFEIVYLAPDNIGVNESLRATFTTRITLTSTSFSNFGNIVLSNELFNLYLAQDIRKGLIIKGLGRNSNRNEMTKFISKSGTSNLDNVPVIRISEVYLNRAEAYARSGQDPLALADLNRIRTRAGLTARIGISGQALVDEILLQRRLELAFEGHRFFDMKRLGMDIVKESGNIPHTDFRILARIPIREVENNPNLVQNTGY